MICVEEEDIDIYSSINETVRHVLLHMHGISQNFKTSPDSPSF